MLLIGVGLTLVSLAAMVSPAAVAADDCDGGQCAVPRCDPQSTYARPGVDRSFGLSCSYFEGATVAAAPEHGQLRDFRVEGGEVRYRYTPAEGPTDDAFTVRLTGNGMEREQRIPIVIVPRDRNSAPQCRSTAVAKRSDGTGPAEVEFQVDCWDPDHDEMTIEGGGPGVHLNSPMAMRGGMAWHTSTHWRYRTATHQGDEQATYYATDVLGARSEDAAVSIRVGPDVDRKPTCFANGWTWLSDDVRGIDTRDGRVRRFGVYCSDPDGDAILPRVESQPTAGVLAFVPDPTAAGASWMWSQAVYTPTAPSTRDDFSVVAGGARGDGPAARMAMMTVPDERNEQAGSCGWSPPSTYGGPTVGTVSCDDVEGDPLEAEIIRGPEHGTALPPVVTPGRNGYDDISVAYTPDPGFVGIDCVVLKISDGRGFDRTFELDVYVRGAVPVELPPVEEPVVERPLPRPPAAGARPPQAVPGATAGVTWANGQPVPPASLAPSRGTLPLPVSAPAPQAPGAAFQPSTRQTPAVPPLAQARRALGSKRVRLAGRVGNARVYVARGRMAVTCAVRCQVVARPMGTATASRLPRTSATPGTATIVSLPKSTRRARLAITDALGRRDKLTVTVR